MKKTNNSKPELMPLCSCCASQFYQSGTCRIRRANPFQTEKDSCTYCGFRRGFDYLIYPVNIQNRSEHPRRTRKGGSSLCTVRTAY